MVNDATRTLEMSLLDHVILLSKALDNRIYAKCWIMLSFSDAAFRFRGDTVIRLRSRFA